MKYAFCAGARGRPTNKVPLKIGHFHPESDFGFQGFVTHCFTTGYETPIPETKGFFSGILISISGFAESRLHFSFGGQAALFSLLAGFFFLLLGARPAR
jgi:hypothetical protein